MQNSKLFSLLKSLNDEELRWMGKLVRSPFHNSSKHLITLFDLLRKHYPSFKSPHLEKEKLFGRLFPDLPFDVRRMDMMMNRLSNLVEQFMVVRRLQRDGFQYKKMLVEEYGERDLYPFFEKGTEGLLADLDAMPYRDEIYYREKYEVNLKYFGHPGVYQMGKEEYLESAVRNFNKQKKLTDLKLQCAVNAVASNSNKRLTSMPEEEGPGKGPLFFLYQKLASVAGVFDDIEELKSTAEIFKKHIDVFRVGDRYNILKMLLNNCARLTNKGNAEFSNLGFELYKIGLENRCLFFNEKMTEVTFHNIVTYGTVAKEFDWTKEFIEKYQFLLDENIREDAVTMSKGQWYFEKNEYHKCIEVLNYHFKNPQDIMKSRSLLIRSWFEIFTKDNSYFDLLISQIEAFEKYMRRDKKLSKRLVEAFVNFSVFTKRIAHAKLAGKKTDRIKNEIEKSENIVLKKWLLEKLDD